MNEEETPKKDMEVNKPNTNLYLKMQENASNIYKNSNIFAKMAYKNMNSYANYGVSNEYMENEFKKENTLDKKVDNIETRVIDLQKKLLYSDSMVNKIKGALINQIVMYILIVIIIIFNISILVKKACSQAETNSFKSKNSNSNIKNKKNK